MIQVRTRSMALKDWFADVLNGMAIGEYDYNTVIEEADKTIGVDGRPMSRAEQLRNMFSEKKEVRDVEVEIVDQPEASEVGEAPAELVEKDSAATDGDSGKGPVVENPGAREEDAESFENFRGETIATSASGPILEVSLK